MGVRASETCWAVHTSKRQVINLWNCCICLVDLFETYEDARTCKLNLYICKVALPTVLEENLLLMHIQCWATLPSSSLLEYRIVYYKMRNIELFIIRCVRKFMLYYYIKLHILTPIIHHLWRLQLRLGHVAARPLSSCSARFWQSWPHLRLFIPGIFNRIFWKLTNTTLFWGGGGGRICLRVAVSLLNC
jgi:hypothetical protein